MREHKGESLLQLPDEYVIIDIESTGLDPYFDEIIEIAAIRIINNEITEKFSSLVHTDYELDEFIMDLTGIKNSDLSDAPSIDAVLTDFHEFIGNSILMGHNVNFDINFLYDSSEFHIQKTLSNNFIDTLRLARRAYPNLKTHTMNSLIKEFNIPCEKSHRALYDCISTFHLYNILRKELSGKPELLISRKKHKKTLDAKEILANVSEFDTSHPLYGKTCVFTGSLEKMIRRDAMQIVVNLGGLVANSVTAKTNYLILGINDYSRIGSDGKSTKHKKAEKLKLEGKEIEIISENVFYDMIFG